jgi:hypothetical protein
MIQITRLNINGLLTIGRPIILFILFLLMTPNQALSSNEYIKNKTKGIIIGSAFSNEKFDGGIHYMPIQFIYKLNYPVFKNQFSKRSNLFLHIEPQFNLVIYGSRLDAFETGVNLGFTYNYLIAQKWIAFVGLGAGPHYLSKETSKLAKGFTFSDNFMLGIRKRVKIKQANYEIEFQTRFRHMSNAGLKQPTAGIDAFLFLFGISRLF